MGFPNSFGATMNIRTSRDPFILNGSGMNLNLCYISFHARNFLFCLN
jgi:hypothetical protein